MYNSMTPYQPGPEMDSTTRLLIGMKQKGTLQSYVAAHQGTPEYPMLLAMATSINNISAAEQAAKYQPPTQTVAEQRLASLAPQQPQPAPQALPESQGIGQLPAPNLETVGKAAGGIIAFGDGGEVPRFNGATTSVVPRPIQRMPGDPLAAEWDRMYGNMYNPNGSLKLAPEYVRNPATKTYEKNPVRAEQDMALFEAANTAYMTDRDAKLAAAPSLDDGTDKTDKTGLGRIAPDKAPVANPNAGLPSLKSAEQRLRDAVYKNAPDKEAQMQEMADIDKPVIDKVKESIEAQKGKLKTEGEQNFFMSMVLGGAAMASGDSQYALQNIAQGVKVGGTHFNEGLKDLRKAAEDNRKAEIDLAKYEATGKKDALKSYNENMARRDDRYAQGMSTMLGQEISGQYQLAATREHAAATRANGPLAIYNALGGGDLAKGFQMAKQIEAGTKKDLMTEYTAWLTANPTASTLEPEKAAAQFLKTKGLFDLATGMQAKITPTNKPVGKVLE